jgi:hypothetical protein
MVIVGLLALLALFSIIGFVASAEDPNARSDPRENPLFWMTLTHR